MKEKYGWIKDYPYLCTIILIGINVVTFLILSFQGMTEDPEFMLNHGAMFWPALRDDGEYYRLFTCMFLHFGFEHLMSNMIMLGLMGMRLEPLLGFVRFLILYLGSGLAGNIISTAIEWYQGDMAVSAGASGAIFGVVGGVLWIVLMNRTGRRVRGYGRIDLNQRDMLILLGLSLYSGFTESGIDNAAHIGGLISGMILAMVLTIGLLEKKNTD